MRLVSYLRVSTDGQVDGWGLDTQRDAIARWAAGHGHEVVAEYRDEGVSGTLPATERAGLRAALDDPDAEGLVVARLDRLARTLTVQEMTLALLWRAGWTVATADTGVVQQDDPEDPVRTTVRQVLGAFAEYERAMVVKRLRDGRRAKAAAGGHPSGSYPFGSTKAGPDDREQQVLVAVADLRARGLTWQQGADWLNDRGPAYAPRSAQRWTPGNLRAVATG